MKVREYARHRGISHVAVLNAIKSGRLSRAVSKDTKGKPVIDAAIADEEWTPGRQEIVKEQAIERPKAADVLGGNSVASSYAKARAVRENFNARLAQLEYEEAQGKLVSAEKVKHHAFKVSRTVRDAMLNIPDRIAAELAAEKDQFTVHKRMTEEIRIALEGLSEEIISEEEDGGLDESRG